MADILIIDDDPGLRRVMARTLTGEGHLVHEAENGIAGLAAFDRFRPELVITDMIMPEKEGIETIRHLRQLAPTLPILAISGTGNRTFFLHVAIALGADASLEKPFYPAQLRKLVRDLLNPARGAAELLPRLPGSDVIAAAVTSGREERPADGALT